MTKNGSGGYMTGDQIARTVGIIYTGVQEVYRGGEVYLFTDTYTKSTFAVKRLDRVEVENGLNDLRARFKK